MGNLRARLTYANVMATIAMFIALGGASYAALKLPKNSVGAKQLKKKAVTTAKIKKEAVTAAKIRKGTLTGSQINVNSLGTVPSAQNASQLGGIGPEGYVKGGGSILRAWLGLSDGQTEQPLLSIAGVGSFTVSCTDNADTFFTRFTNLSGGRVVRIHGERLEPDTTEITGGSLANGDSTNRTSTAAGSNDAHLHNYEIAPADGPGPIAHVRIAAVSSVDNEPRCVVSASAIVG